MRAAEIEQVMGRATALQRRGETDAAAALYRQILKQHRDLAPAHYNLALLLKDQGKTQAAEKSFKAAVTADKGYRLGWRGYARFLSRREKHREAIRAGLKMAALDDYSDNALQEVADLVAGAGTADLGAPGDEAMLRCLGRDGVESDRMINALLARLRRHPGLQSPPKSKDDWPKFSAALTEPVIAAAFASLILPAPDMEAHVEAGRRLILGGEVTAEPEVIALLALQLSLCEYALAPPPGEPPLVTGLESALLAALYAPLQPEMADEILEKGEATLTALPWCGQLIVRMGPEKMREWVLKATLPSLSTTGDKVSRAVRAQYEESPYPRWRGLRAGGETTLPALLRTLFPALPPHPVSAAPAVLVAGCGTGRHALRTARRIKDCTVTAIDLSRRSLSYGARQAEALEIANVTFAEADILDLPDTLGPFDLIEACGVLHHMADPEAAWRGLLHLLAPGGVMKVALYSESARQDVVAVREMVGEGIGTLDLDDMRALRKKIQALPEDHPAKGVTRELDFYSLSGCRDLLFHRHEQRFDIPRLQAALTELGLEFLGFEFTESRVMEAYRARHGDDPGGRNLANWAEIEAENPTLFRGMYQFWCRVKK